MAYKKSLKSQAALEFLTTYGWAFLVILIMIGTLAYFGILSPGKILPNRCNFGAEFACLDHQLKADGTLKIKLKNNAGEPITIDAGKIILGSESTTQLSCPTLTPALPYAGWRSGEIKDLTFSGCNTAAAGLVSGQKGKVLMTIKYYSSTSGSGYEKEVQGEIFSTVIG